MTFAVAARISVTLPAPRRVAGAAAVCLAALLTACGGGDQVEKFRPAKLVSFGDEASVLASESVDVGGTSVGTLKGLKYTVNSLALEQGVAELFIPAVPSGALITSTWDIYPTAPEIGLPTVVPDTGNSVVRRLFTLDVSYTLNGTPVNNPASQVGFDYAYVCTNNRLWIQLLANSYGKGYKDQCAADSEGAHTYAEAGARVSTDVTVDGVLRKSIKSQVAAHRSELDATTMVTILAGQNDVLQAYFDVRNSTLASNIAITQMRDRGRELAAIVNDITTTRARVVIVTLPSLWLSPYARQGDADLMKALTDSFNNGLTLTDGLINDGRKIALVALSDETSNIESALVNNTTYYGFTNISTPLCTSGRRPDGSVVTPAVAPFFGGDELRYCNSATINNSLDISTYFWADEVNLSPGAHARLGSFAYDRVENYNQF